MYRATIVRPVVRLLLVCCLCIGASACGQKGDLYMPEQGDANQTQSAQQK